MKINMKSKSVTLATKGCYCPEDVEIEAKMQEKTATANGEVVADSGFAGLSKVIVAVPEPDAKIVDVDELPETDIDDSVYYRMDGKLYKYKPETAVGTWVLNETLTGTFSVTVDATFSLAFPLSVTQIASSDVYDVNSVTPVSAHCTHIYASNSGEFAFSGVSLDDTTHDVSGFSENCRLDICAVFCNYPDSPVYRFDNNAFLFQTSPLKQGYVSYDNVADSIWANSVYRAITIAACESEYAETLLAWLKVNATRQGASAAGWQCYLVPDGSVTIAENGTVDVTDKKEVVVNVEGSGDKLWAYLNLTTLHINQAESFTQSGTSLEVNV